MTAWGAPLILTSIVEIVVLTIWRDVMRGVGNRVVSLLELPLLALSRAIARWATAPSPAPAPSGPRSGADLETT